MAKKKEKRTFEDALDELEKIAEELESGELPLEDAMEKYEAGVKALKECYSMLDAAEKKIEKLVKELDGTIKAEPFEDVEDNP